MHHLYIISCFFSKCYFSCYRILSPSIKRQFKPIYLKLTCRKIMSFLNMSVAISQMVSVFNFGKVFSNNLTFFFYSFADCVNQSIDVSSSHILQGHLPQSTNEPTKKIFFTKVLYVVMFVPTLDSINHLLLLILTHL